MSADRPVTSTMPDHPGESPSSSDSLPEPLPASLPASLIRENILEMLGTLAGGVAHDFNNLLQAILGNAGLIREHAPFSPEILNCLDQIETAAHRASELTRQLLAYAGKGKFVIEPLDLSKLAYEMSKLLEASLPRRASILGHFPRELPAVEGDPIQVRQVVMNLVINAAESLPQGNGVVQLSTGLVHLASDELSAMFLGGGLAAGKYAYVEVCDTGCGMTDEIRAKIFEPFFTTKDTGRGLGLAAVLGIVRGHKGALEVHSEPGAGTVVRALFPVSRSPIGGLSRTINRAPGQQRSGGTILVVDDEPAIRQSAKLLLETIGFSAVAAGDGRAALEILRQQPSEISAVLLDLTMPQMSGNETLRELRSVRPDLPILLTSGYSGEESERPFHVDRWTSFIRKPYRAAELRSKLEELLSARAQPHSRPAPGSSGPANERE